MNKPKCKILTIADDFDLKVWLETQAEDHQLKYLLAHADDGVIWGKFQHGNGKLITTTEPIKLFPECDFPLFREETLQQCRIFGDNSEVIIWKTDEGFKARLIQDDHRTYALTKNIIYVF
ncbi:hypothetical protein H6F32_15955 [Anabaena sp. FACHB-1237]|uniref:type III-D CRISPR-associated protein Csx19 n=1 Tax=Anabaena sp. FACHB-1237 TaxID=2692769 RepID=UPI0016815EEF|nr:CRISPR-associated protein Csx19 [Anabaena sp. FACHB-1237]MBD2139030.1 hypothetical protein [Anabaena sp. FACHB-1237]